VSTLFASRREPEITQVSYLWTCVETVAVIRVLPRAANAVDIIF